MKKYIRLGVKFGGKCGFCGRDTGNRSFELANTLLYEINGKFAPVHAQCAGVRVKHGVNGRASVAGTPRED